MPFWMWQEIMQSLGVNDLDKIKQSISNKIKELVGGDINIEELLEKPKVASMGDVAFPCFRLAGIYHKSPMDIAADLGEKLKSDLPFGVSKIEIVGGYINFFADSSYICKTVLADILTKKEDYLKSDIGNGKTICIDYSSPNIAKPFHIGHLRTTIIGASLYKLYKALGYNTVGINHLGDFGTQFGYVIEGYKRWKDEYDLATNPIGSLVDIYVRINTLAKEDESIQEAARHNFMLLEKGDKEVVDLWSKFRELSLKEYKRIYERLGVEFDSYNGEAFYNDKMQEVVDILKQKGVLKESNGAMVVDVENEQVPCMILKSNGSTTYATRDLAAVLYRAREYDFTKCLYVTGGEQALHFRQVFSTAKYIVGEEKASGLYHIPFGMVLGPDGKKFSTRKGAKATIEGVLDEAVDRAKEVLIEKGKALDVDETAEIIGKGAIIFNDLKNNRIKDEVFDLDDMLKFEGETGPYVMYTYVRTKSILEKAGGMPELNMIDFENIKEESEIELVKELARAKKVLLEAADEFEPSVITRYTLSLAGAFSKFYNDCQVMVEDEKLRNARLALVYATSIVIKETLGLLGIDCPEKM